MRTAQEAAEAAGETVPQFIGRAVDSQVEQDRRAMRLGINPATGGKLERGE